MLRPAPVTDSLNVRFMEIRQMREGRSIRGGRGVEWTGLEKKTKGKKSTQCVTTTGVDRERGVTEDGRLLIISYGADETTS